MNHSFSDSKLNRFKNKSRIILTLLLAVTIVFTLVQGGFAQSAFAGTTKTSQIADPKSSVAKKHSGRTASKYATSDRYVTIMLTGDLMCKGAQQLAAYDGKNYDFSPTFKYVKEVFSSADVVVGNLETMVFESLPLSKDLPKLQTRPYLNAPKAFLKALKDAGYTGLVLANNHNCDGGPIAITETIEAVDKYGFQRTGLYKNAEEKHYFIAEEKGFKIGFLAYATYYNRKDDFLSPEQQETMLAMNTEEAVRKDVEALRNEGVDYIIAYNHAGTEYVQTASQRQIRYDRILADCGVDYIIGSHPHVLQNASRITTTDGERSVPVMFSMGNFISSLSNELTRETLIYTLTLAKDKDGNVYLANQDYIPCYMPDEWGDDSYVLVPKGYEKTGTLAQRKELPEKWKHITEVVERKKVPFGERFSAEY